jgi:replicative DNA helicase
MTTDNGTHAPASAAAQAIRAALDGAVTVAGADLHTLGPWWDTFAALMDADPPDRARVFRALDTANKGALSALLATGGDAQRHGSWGAIAPFDSPELPSFPLETLPPALRAMVTHLSIERQTPPDLAAMLALSVLSTCCAGRVRIQVRPGWTEPLNLYTVTALPPGSGKSGVFSAMTAPIMRWERDLVQQVKQDIAARKAEREVVEARLNRAKNEAARAATRDDRLAAEADVDSLARELADMEESHIPQLIVDDVTPETLVSLLAANGGRMAALSSEGDLFAIMAGRYSSNGANLGVFLKSHSGDMIRVNRRDRGAHVPHPVLTLGLTVQPDIVRGLGGKREFAGQGLLGRLLYAMPESILGRRDMDAPSVPFQVQETYAELVTALLATYGPTAQPGGGSEHSEDCENDRYNRESRSIIIIILTIPAYERLQAFRRWLEPQLAPDAPLGSFADWASKLPGAIARIAGLLHCASAPPDDPLPETTMAAAIAIGQYLIAHARAAYNLIGADPNVEAAQRVLRWIEQRGVTSFTKRDAYQGTKGTFKTVAALEPALELLEEHGYIRARSEEDRAGPGRKPSPTYDVHPSLTR